MGKYTAIITARQEGGEVQVPAIVYGSWAAHRSVGNTQWTITHVPSGKAVPQFHTALLTKAQAIEAAKRLDDEIGDRKVTRSIGKVIVGIIHRVLTGKATATDAEVSQ